MASEKGQVRLNGTFAANTEVRLYERNGDTFSPGQSGRPLKTKKTSKESRVTFDGLEVGGRYWVVGAANGRDDWAVQVTGKEQRAAKPKSSPLDSAAPGESTSENVKIVTGARNTKSVDPPPTFGHRSIGKPSKDPEAQPYVSQEDVQGVKQRSDTITGEAHPRPVDEFSPAVPQSEVPKSTPQRSSTELGEATIIPAGEKDAAPSVRQEDQKGKQRSATELGEATPIPEWEQKPTKAKARKRSRKVQATPSASRASAKTPASGAEKVEPVKQKRPAKRSSKSSDARKGRR